MYPRMLFYAFFFVGVLSVEVMIAVARLMIGELLPYDYILMVIVTATAIVLFLLEEFLSRRDQRTKLFSKHI